MGDATIGLKVARYRPEHGPSLYSDEYQVPYSEDMVVLDALNYIKDNIDGSVSYRWSCRMGVCGSCGMMVNYVPRLTCSTFLREFYPKPVVDLSAASVAQLLENYDRALGAAKAAALLAH